MKSYNCTQEMMLLFEKMHKNVIKKWGKNIEKEFESLLKIRKERNITDGFSEKEENQDAMFLFATNPIVKNIIDNHLEFVSKVIQPDSVSNYKEWFLNNVKTSLETFLPYEDKGENI